MNDERDGSAPHDVVRPFPERRRVPFRQWPLSLVLAGVAISMAIIAFGSFRRGCVILAATVLIAAFLRLFLSSHDAGMLAVRSRTIDVSVLLAMGIGLAILSFWVPAPN